MTRQPLTLRDDVHVPELRAAALNPVAFTVNQIGGLRRIREEPERSAGIRCFKLL